MLNQICLRLHSQFLYSQKPLTVFLIIVNSNFTFHLSGEKMPSSLFSFSHIPHSNPLANIVACVFKHIQTLLWLLLTSSTVTTCSIDTSPSSLTLYFCNDLLISLSPSTLALLLFILHPEARLMLLKNMSCHFSIQIEPLALHVA